MRTRPWFHHHSIVEIVHPQEAAASEHKWITYYRNLGAPLENKTMPDTSRAPDRILVHRVIKQASREKGIPLRVLASIAGTTRMAISHVIAGTSQSRRLRRVICNELDLDPSEFGWRNIAAEYADDKKKFRFTILPKA
mgnify:FL=1